MRVLRTKEVGIDILPGDCLEVRSAGGEVFFELTLADAWVWDVYRSARFVKQVRVVTFKDVNVEELDKPELRLPEENPFG